MGIRFYCPHGHKLNVKEFQAGRKGICPYCGAKIEIPTESTRKSAKQQRAERGAAGGPVGEVSPSPVVSPESQPVVPVSAPQVDPGVPGSSGQPSVATGSPPSVSAPSADVGPAGAQVPNPNETASSESSLAATETAKQSSDSRDSQDSPTPTDPLAEAGDAVWYVRPASGGQFGPAGADVMRSWITDGRVSPDSLVWREGWKDWQEGAEVFPQLKADGPPSPFGDIPPANLSTGSTTSAGSGSTGFVRPRRRSSRTQAIVITVLVLAVIALAVVFVMVLTSNSNAAEARTVGAEFEAAYGRNQEGLGTRGWGLVLSDSEIDGWLVTEYGGSSPVAALARFRLRPESQSSTDS